MQDLIHSIFALGQELLPFALMLLLVIFVLPLAHKLLLGDKHLEVSKRFSRQLILLLFYVIAIIALVIALPLEPSIRNQILALIGILLSGVIAFSSTSLVANVMAGIVFRFTKPFRTGDFIIVGEHAGRVTERGLFDTEIQTEQRELIALTNAYLLNQPITVVRSSGTIISTTLSLGYDLHHSHIEKLLLQAANDIELQEPFVQILELGDFSITYRISGLLTEIKSMISARSRLMGAVLNTLHENGIEIVSPSFMNQRRMDDKPPVIPKQDRRLYAEKRENDTLPEEIIFDKAEEAESKEKQVETLKGKILALKEKLKSAEGDDKDKLKAQIEKREQSLETLLAQDKKAE